MHASLRSISVITASLDVLKEKVKVGTKKCSCDDSLSAVTAFTSLIAGTTYDWS